MSKLLSISFFLFLLTSCEPSATFDKPQPDGINSLATFPNRLKGNYLNTDKASILTIADKIITLTYDIDLKTNKNKLDSFYVLIGDSLFNKHTGIKEKVVLKEDTILQTEHLVDTLFLISPNNILKKFKGYYFLNLRYTNDKWVVQKISLERGQLTVGNISAKTDIANLKEITETSNDTISTHFSLTKKQFKKFIKGKKGFSEQESFTRMANNSNVSEYNK